MKISLSLLLFLLPLSLQAETVAVVVLQHPTVSSGTLERFQEGVVKSLPTRLKIVRTTQEDIKGLESLLQEELKQAREAYYRLDLEGATRLIAQRSDPDALLLAAMIANSRGDEAGTRLALERVLMKDPGYSLSPRDFPPQIVTTFKKISHPANPPLPTMKLGNIDFSLADLPKWEGVLGRWRQKNDWDEILLLSLTPIGWNYKVTATQVPCPEYVEGGTPLGKTQIVELKDLKELSQAAKILTKTYFVDTSPDIQ